MRVLVVGGGGREHAIVWKLDQSERIEKIFTAPGNAGTALHGENIPVKDNDIDGLLKVVKENNIDLTIVGPEVPLMLGIVDRFQDEGMKIFGPTLKAAMLEGSKVFAKEFMSDHEIPTADYIICHNRLEAEDITNGKEFPYVLKVDGLAAGKGALIINNKEDKRDAFQTIWVENKFGKAGDSVLIEDFLNGEELSVFAITDGKDYVLLHPAQDHKRIFDGEKGPNTGGMGAYAPAPLGTPDVIKKVEEKIIKPVLKGMRKIGNPYTGVLYCGLMIEHGEPYVIEFNSRFGDPESQVVIPLIDSDLVDILHSIALGQLNKGSLKLSDKFAACIVMASKGYPGSYEIGKTITGLESKHDIKDSNNGAIFLAGTAFDGKNFKTSGGRVLGVTACAKNLKDAIDEAYNHVRKIHFDGAYFREDIGKKGLGLNDS